MPSSSSRQSVLVEVGGDAEDDVGLARLGAHRRQVGERGGERLVADLRRGWLGSRRKWTPSTRASTEVAVAPPGTVTAASSPLPRRTRGPGCGQPLPYPRQQLELAHARRFSPLRVAGSSPRLTKVRRTWSAASHFYIGSARPGASFGTRPPRSKRVRLAIQLGIAVLVFGFLVLTVVDQWSEIQDKGVHFHVLWLIPAFVILPIFYALSALGWDLILRFLGYRIGRRAGAGRLGPAAARPLRARQRPLRARPGAALRAGRGAAADDDRQHRLRTGDLGHLGDRLRRLLPDQPSRPAGPAAALGGAAADPAGDRRPAPARLRAAGQPRAARLRPRAAARGDAAARRDRADRSSTR